MNPNEFLSKLYKYEIKIRKAVTSQMRGNFHSIFKGSGLEFSDLRLYQYGDDVRLIDWNTSAKGHGTFIKIFKEEKEQRKINAREYLFYYLIHIQTKTPFGKTSDRLTWIMIYL